VNNGKTPATDIDGHFSIETVQNGVQPRLDYNGRGVVATVGTLFPNDPKPIPIVRQRNLPMEGITVIGDIPAVDDPLTPEEIQSVDNVAIFFVTYGTVSYKDFFGTKHETKFCAFWRTPANIGLAVSARKCTDYNRIDTNPN